MTAFVPIRVAENSGLSPAQKETSLLARLADARSLIVALSAGADSAYLAWAAQIGHSPAFEAGRIAHLGPPRFRVSRLARALRHRSHSRAADADRTWRSGAARTRLPPIPRALARQSRTRRNRAGRNGPRVLE